MKPGELSGVMGALHSHVCSPHLGARALEAVVAFFAARARHAREPLHALVGAQARRLVVDPGVEFTAPSPTGV